MWRSGQRGTQRIGGWGRKLLEESLETSWMDLQLRANSEERTLRWLAWSPMETLCGYRGICQYSLFCHVDVFPPPPYQGLDPICCPAPLVTCWIETTQHLAGPGSLWLIVIHPQLCKSPAETHKVTVAEGYWLSLISLPFWLHSLIGRRNVGDAVRS